jgi:hypothetical protein
VPPSHVQMDKVFTLRAPRDESTLPHHGVPSGETDALMAPPSCPPSIGEDFHPKAPHLTPAYGHGSSPFPVSSTTPPLEEDRRIPKHHLGAATSTSQPLWPHHHGDNRYATLTKKEKSPTNHIQATPRPQPATTRPRSAAASHSQTSPGRG